MPQLAFVKSVSQAVRVVKELGLQPTGWEEEDWHLPVKEAIAQAIEEGMARQIGRHLEEMESRGIEDRRNGSYPRNLLTGMGNIEIHVPRTRTFSAVRTLQRYARRTREVDRVILAGFIFGLSTRKVSKALIGMLGEPVSPMLVSRVAKTLDAAVAAFHRRPLMDIYKVLLFDGVVLARKTGAGAIRRPVLVVMGIRPDGRKEVIDFRLAVSESEAEWEYFLSDIQKRGLEGKQTEIICSDGGQGLLSALQVVYPGIRVQRCWAHKMRNLTDKVRKADRKAAKRSLQKIYLAKNIVKARAAANCCARRWQEKYPKMVASLQYDLDDLLAFFTFKEEKWRRYTRTTNAIERRFVEVRRRTRPMGVFSDRTSIERILFAVFTNENQSQGIWTPLLLTHNS
jgi:putative transposase